MFPQIKFKILSQLIEFFILREYNADKALETLKQSLNFQISKLTIYKIYKEFRNILYKYILIEYINLDL